MLALLMLSTQNDMSESKHSDLSAYLGTHSKPLTTSSWKLPCKTSNHATQQGTTLSRSSPLDLHSDSSDAVKRPIGPRVPKELKKMSQCFGNVVPPSESPKARTDAGSGRVEPSPR